MRKLIKTKIANDFYLKDKINETTIRKIELNDEDKIKEK